MFAQCAIELPASDQFPEGKRIVAGEEVDTDWFRDQEEIDNLVAHNSLADTPPGPVVHENLEDRILRVADENPDMSLKDFLEGLGVNRTASDAGNAEDTKGKSGAAAVETAEGGD